LAGVFRLIGGLLVDSDTERFVRLEVIAENTGNLVADHESRLRRIERWTMYGCGVAAALSLGLHFVEVFK
jgi:hypothetical protein